MHPDIPVIAPATALIPTAARSLLGLDRGRCSAMPLSARHRREIDQGHSR
jgi:hypothetical protein